MKHTIKITAEDLTGWYFSPHDCPLARAFKRAFPDTDVRVGGTFIRLDLKFYDFSKELREYSDSIYLHKAAPREFEFER
jgi:hypothetical protein